MTAVVASKLDVNLKKLQDARAELEYRQASRLRQEERREAVSVERLQKRLASLKMSETQRAQRNQRLLAAADALAKRVDTEDSALSGLVAARAAAGREQAAWVQSTLRSFTQCVDQLVPVLQQQQQQQQEQLRQQAAAAAAAAAAAQQWPSCNPLGHQTSPVHSVAEPVEQLQQRQQREAAAAAHQWSTATSMRSGHANPTPGATGHQVQLHGASSHPTGQQDSGVTVGAAKSVVAESSVDGFAISSQVPAVALAQGSVSHAFSPRDQEAKMPASDLSSSNAASFEPFNTTSTAAPAPLASSLASTSASASASAAAAAAAERRQAKPTITVPGHHRETQSGCAEDGAAGSPVSSTVSTPTVPDRSYDPTTDTGSYAPTPTELQPSGNQLRDHVHEPVQSRQSTLPDMSKENSATTSIVPEQATTYTPTSAPAPSPSQTTPPAPVPSKTIETIAEDAEAEAAAATPAKEAEPSRWDTVGSEVGRAHASAAAAEAFLGNRPSRANTESAVVLRERPKASGIFDSDDSDEEPTRDRAATAPERMGSQGTATPMDGGAGKQATKKEKKKKKKGFFGGLFGKGKKDKNKATAGSPPADPAPAPIVDSTATSAVGSTTQADRQQQQQQQQQQQSSPSASVDSQGVSPIPDRQPSPTAIASLPTGNVGGGGGSQASSRPSSRPSSAGSSRSVGSAHTGMSAASVGRPSSAGAPISMMDQLKAKQSAVAGYGRGGQGGAASRVPGGYRPHTAPASTGPATLRGQTTANAKPWEKLAKETAGAAFQDNSADDFDDDF